MNDITELPDEWRKQTDGYGIVPKPQKQCADQLEAALPKWTKITDDPETWPDDGVDVIMWQEDNGLWFENWGAYSFQQPTETHWRLLCSIDYPPKEVSGE